MNEKTILDKNGKLLMTYHGPIKFIDWSASTLDYADLSDRDLDGIFVCGVRLVGVRFDRSSLYWAGFVECDLSDASFSFADLRGANLEGSKFDGANFLNANLGRDSMGNPANIRGADLRGADLSKAVLDGAVCDEDTKFPPGVDLSRFHLTWGSVSAPPDWITDVQAGR